MIDILGIRFESKTIIQMEQPKRQFLNNLL